MMKRFFEPPSVRFQPDRVFSYNDNPNYYLDQRFLASLVGVTAVALPIVLFSGTWFGTCFYDSISHFYYAQFLGGIFLAALVFIATFMIAYRGDNPRESRYATIAGICTLLVALFPTEGRGCELTEFSGRALVDFTRTGGADFVTITPVTPDTAYFQLIPFARYLHYGSAAILFSFLAYYCFRVFTRVIAAEQRQEDHQLSSVKRTRNHIYRLSGTAIVIAMLAMFAKLVFGGNWQWWDQYNVTFFLETLALWAFGVSWIVKGRGFSYVLLDARDRRRA